MTIYKSKSGRTAVKLIDEITSLFCSYYRLESHQWHHVGNSEPFDPYTSPDDLLIMLTELVEHLDTQEFDLSKSAGVIGEEQLS